MNRTGATNRITPEMVLAAYEKTGFKPRQGSFFSWHMEQRCACGLGAIYAAETGKHVGYSSFLNRRYGDHYYTGFIGGFDGNGFPHHLPDGAKQGYEDGRACWEAVKHLAEEDYT